MNINNVIITDGLESNNHSVFILNFRLTLTTKDMRKIINKEISDALKLHFEKLSIANNISLINWENNKNHIHIFYKAHPNTHHSKFINSYKSASSRLIKKEFPEIILMLSSLSFWSRSFLLVSIGELNCRETERYLKTQ